MQSEETDFRSFTFKPFKVFIESRHRTFRRYGATVAIESFDLNGVETPTDEFRFLIERLLVVIYRQLILG